MVSPLSNELIQNYTQYVSSPKKVTTEDMFAKLSKDLGGNGKTITKKDLDAYVEKAEEDGNVSATKLDALKSLQKKWDDISGGKDSVNFADMKGNTNILGLAYTSDVISSMKATSESSDSSSSNSIKDMLINSATGGTNTNSTDLPAYLKTLLTENSDENDNSDEIDLVVNLLAKQGLLKSGNSALSLSAANYEA